jgi:hypothetical protein
MKYGKRPLNNALEYPIRNGNGIGFDVRFKGERRTEKKPFGRLARYVDPNGHVMILQTSTPGHAVGEHQRDANEKAMRVAKVLAGWVPHGECPLLHDTQRATKDLAEEFASMPEDLRVPCEHDPKTYERIAGQMHAQESCPHVEWLILDRRRRQEEELARMYPDRAALQRLEAERRELHSAQVEVTRAQLAEVRESKSKRAK